MQFLLITASSYDDLTYDVPSGQQGVVLDAAQLFNGAGAVALLGASPVSLTFDLAATAAADVTVQILVGRDATP